MDSIIKVRLRVPLIVKVTVKKIVEVRVTEIVCGNTSGGNNGSNSNIKSKP